MFLTPTQKVGDHIKDKGMEQTTFLNKLGRIYTASFSTLLRSEKTLLTYLTGKIEQSLLPGFGETVLLI